MESTENEVLFSTLPTNLGNRTDSHISTATTTAILWKFQDGAVRQFQRDTPPILWVTQGHKTGYMWTHKESRVYSLRATHVALPFTR
jgi:hypothetical protein